MQIAKFGLIDKMTEKMQPALHLFPKKYQKNIQQWNIFLLMSLQIFLGLGWGATPLGLKEAMEELAGREREERKGKNPNPPAMKCVHF